MDFVGVGGEVDEGTPLEAEDRCVRVAVLPVLANGMAPRLTGHQVLEFTCRHRHTIEGKDEVERIFLARMAWHLPRYGELVALETRQGVRIEAVRRCEEGEVKPPPVELETVAQHVERALVVEFPGNLVDEHRLQVVAVQCCHARPLVGLCLADEGDGVRREQCAFDIPISARSA